MKPIERIQEPARQPLEMVVIGAGYVGLVTAACLAEIGHHVICVDNNHAKIDALLGGRVPIFEPGLDEVISRAIKAQRLGFAVTAVPYLPGADAVFLAVGTPPREDGEGANLSFVMAACQELAENATAPLTVIVKSTVPPGTGDILEQAMRGWRPDLDFHLVSNPEFLREGSAIGDFMHPDRIVCGTSDEVSRILLTNIYWRVLETGAVMVFAGRRAAELIKHASNAFLAMKISFINEMADLCEAVKADIGEVAQGVGLDKRIGSQFLKAGPGYGGSCFPKDAAALLAVAGEYGIQMRALEGAVGTNGHRRRAMARRVMDAMGGNVQGATIAVLGLAFKANTDDVRESPALALINALQRQGAMIRAYDPQAAGHARALLKNVFFAGDSYHCCQGADCVVLATDWDEFRHLDVPLLARIVGRKLFVDLRNLIPPQQLAREGFQVHGIGRKVVRPRHDIEPGLHGAGQPVVPSSGRGNGHALLGQLNAY